MSKNTHTYITKNTYIHEQEYKHTYINEQEYIDKYTHEQNTYIHTSNKKT